MFLGRYTTYFSGKNRRSLTSYRLMLPKKIRKELGSEDHFYLILGLDGEIWGLDRDNWQKQAALILDKPLNTKEGRSERRHFFSRAEECLLDMQGRFILPQEFVEKAGLKTEVVILGAGDHFEIWDKDRWEQLGRVEK